MNNFFTFNWAFLGLSIFSVSFFVGCITCFRQIKALFTNNGQQNETATAHEMESVLVHEGTPSSTVGMMMGLGGQTQVALDVLGETLTRLHEIQEEFVAYTGTYYAAYEKYQSIKTELYCSEDLIDEIDKLEILIKQTHLELGEMNHLISAKPNITAENFKEITEQMEDQFIKFKQPASMVMEAIEIICSMPRKQDEASASNNELKKRANI